MRNPYTNLTISGHALAQMRSKKFTISALQKAFDNPTRVYPNGRYPGQWRICGNGLCLVGVPTDNSFMLITVYEDGVFTAPRPDQLNTSYGKEYAEQYRTQTLKPRPKGI